MRNVILISVDSLRFDVVSAEITPYIWAFAQRGAFYDCTIVQAPYTVPSHASMLTGLYPFHHGVRQMGGERLPASALTMLDWLRQHGYFVEALQDVPVFGHAQHFGAGFAERPRSTAIKNVRQVLRDAGRRPFGMLLHYWDVHTPYLFLVRPRSVSGVILKPIIAVAVK